MGPSDRRGRLAALREKLRIQLWLLPCIGTVLAVGLGLGLTRLDTRTGYTHPSWLTSYLFGGGASAARTVLSAIASSLITVTSLTFSLTVVTLQLASSQFSPRLLRTFSRDRFVQLTLTLCLATFTYALTVLRTIRSSDEGGQDLVPQLAVTTGFVLALASVLALVLFLGHLAREIRVETLLRQVHRETSKTVRRLLPQRASAPRASAFQPPPANAMPLPAGSSGFVLSIDADAVLAAAVEADAIVLIDCCPGTSVVAGTPMGAAWPRTVDTFAPDAGLRLARQVATAVRTGPERTSARDVTYGLWQLNDVAVKALSPGINDPITAVHALGHASAVLCELADRELGARLLRDQGDSDQGEVVRVVLRQPDLADLLAMTLLQPLHYGAHDPIVLAQMFCLLRDLAWCAPPDQHPAITDQLRTLRAEAAGQRFGPRQRARFELLSDQVEQALAGRWTPAPALL